MICSGPLTLSDLEAVEVGVGSSSSNRAARSNPVNMPMPGGGRASVPVLIESGSYSKPPHGVDLLFSVVIVFYMKSFINRLYPLNYRQLRSFATLA